MRKIILITILPIISMLSMASNKYDVKLGGLLKSGYTIPKSSEDGTRDWKNYTNNLYFDLDTYIKLENDVMKWQVGVGYLRYKSDDTVSLSLGFEYKFNTENKDSRGKEYVDTTFNDITTSTIKTKNTIRINTNNPIKRRAK